jgi:hypothetical protein
MPTSVLDARVRPVRQQQPFQPIVIIGAPRSGTNMLRNVLISLSRFATWPCDEINYVWRCGNAACPHDELRPESVSSASASYICRFFDRLARQTQANWVVEKTCANSLRVPFVDRVLPEAKFIFLVRDGRDAVASAMRRWTAPLEWKYVARKARYVPLRDMPRYAVTFARNRVRRWRSPERRLASWGPRFPGMQEFAAAHSLAEVCALQWQRCVARADEDLSRLDSSRVVRLQYERFVADPLSELQAVLDELKIAVSTQELSSAVGAVSDHSVGKWQTHLDAATVAQITPLLMPQLARFGYANVA